MRIEVKSQESQHVIEAEKVSGQLWIHFKGQTYRQSLPSGGGKSRSRQTGAGTPGDITAPMPGKVTKVSVQVGEEVQLGQLLMVMEAMKMEYTLKANMAGTVSAIQCHSGQQVAMGQLLIQVRKK